MPPRSRKRPGTTFSESTTSVSPVSLARSGHLFASLEYGPDRGSRFFLLPVEWSMQALVGSERRRCTIKEKCCSGRKSEIPVREPILGESGRWELRRTKSSDTDYLEWLPEEAGLVLWGEARRRHTELITNK